MSFVTTHALERAFAGAEVVMHLAAINGTENFYKRPELVLDVGLRGALAVVDAGRNTDVSDLLIASSAEVYQTPTVVPTPETIPLTLPDSRNPRYSYGGSKIISELIAFNYARDYCRKVADVPAAQGLRSGHGLEARRPTIHRRRPQSPRGVLGWHGPVRDSG